MERDLRRLVRAFKHAGTGDERNQALLAWMAAVTEMILKDTPESNGYRRDGAYMRHTRGVRGEIDRGGSGE